MADEKPPNNDLQSDTTTESSHDIEASSNSVPEYELNGLPLVLVISGLAIAIFVMSLDSSIIATAIPEITSQFNSTSDIAWYGGAYSFAMCALQPLSGKIFSSFALKSTFLVYLIIFEIGSLICATAVNSPMLIVGRAIAGAGAAGGYTGAFCIIAVSMPLARRPLYIGILQSTFGFATIIGPLLGGAFTEYVTWRLCFYINLPLGTITVLALYFFFHAPSASSNAATSVVKRVGNLDLVGAFLFIPSVIMLLMALEWGGTDYPWQSATIIGLFIGGIGLCLIFVIWQIRLGDKAMIPPRLLTERTTVLSCLIEFFATGTVYISIYYLPQWFQVVKNVSPTRSSLMYLSLALSDVLSATLTGASLRYIGYPNYYLLLGPALMSIATGLMSTFAPDTSHELWIPYQVLQGLGIGMFLSMPFVATQAVLKPEDIPVGMSLLQCFQFLGAAVYLAVAQSVFENSVHTHLADMGFSQQEINTMNSAGSAGVRDAVSEGQLSDVINAYNDGITNTFYVATSVAAVAFIFAMGLRWKSLKAPKAVAMGV